MTGGQGDSGQWSVDSGQWSVVSGQWLSFANFVFIVLNKLN